jgi:thiol-disulfide isomerase/thioredoxin
LLASLLAASAPVRASTDAESRVLDYIRTHLQPGQPLMVTDLYNRVFTQPDERQALNKLYNAFFRIPLFVANYQQKYKSPPSLAVIAEQFDLRSPAAADVLLRVMESDPRVPRFLTRDPKTGEITHVDVERIEADPKFGQAFARQIGGWEGKLAPDVTLTRLGGGNLHISGFQGKMVLLEIWFTGCPPCMQEAPALVSLGRELSAHGLVIVGANADRVLGLDYDDSVRQRYVQEHHISYPTVSWTKEGDQAYGGIAIFPTLFLIDRKGVVRDHWIGYVPMATLRKAMLDVMSEK